MLDTARNKILIVPYHDTNRGHAASTGATPPSVVMGVARLRSTSPTTTRSLPAECSQPIGAPLHKQARLNDV